ncbi:hypothetical protein [Duganella aceris]|uniref:Uncharacterized protein n=1 Tax=Duganella aceris TaxID=2703883 RepID=A0ABX0FG98_9BURK|nr:hypothetical protein [Duganella aceris]NGZ83592.1 hypothetical protein [Duganella aceris]
MRILFLSVLLACAAARGAGPGTDPAAGWTAVDDAELAGRRGGFDLGNGMLVSLGVERLITVNGTVVVNSRFDIPDVTQLSAVQARLAGEALAGAVVQVGDGNRVEPGPAGQAMGALLIQNSANDQAIRSQTTISTTVGNLALLKAVNFENSLRDALSAAVGK